MAQNDENKRLNTFLHNYCDFVNYYLGVDNLKNLLIHVTTTEIDEKNEKAKIIITKNSNEENEVIYQSEITTRKYFIFLLINSIRKDFITSYSPTTWQIINNKNNTHTQIISRSFITLQIELNNEEKLIEAQKTKLPKNKKKQKNLQNK